MIIIPMAGLSQRFADAGYAVPKYMLHAHGRSVFAHAVASFERYFDALPFTFVVRDVSDTADFVRAECRTLGIRDVRLVVLDGPTSGQAETVALGLKRSQTPASSPVTIFNIDTFRPGFRFPTGFDVARVDGFLEVFRGTGANWSYVRPASPDSDRVIETAEKMPISDLCCTGLYHFGSAGLFLDAYEAFVAGAAAAMGLRETYVAPMYNLLIREGRDIRYSLIGSDEVIFCGVPAEYEAFKLTSPA
ncbi:MAG TPA: glycosyltransferase family 2 protein [Clostridia bacterium]|nr:glycosyltransferase family 2 protein [Clostridia bacterium]